jgi:p-aminobenzoyl-glutamate transporter AbgT
MNISRSQAREPVKIGELLLVIGVAAASLLYLFDARAASLSPQNLLLIQPLTVVVVAICLYLAFRIVRPKLVEGPVTGDQRAQSIAKRYGDEIKIGLMLALMGAYVFSLETIGMDVATFVFIAAALLLQGERRWHVVLPISAALALLIVWAFGLMTPFPMTNRILPG